LKISRRTFLKTGGALVASALQPSCAEKKPRNVLFIITDQQPVDVIGAYGNKWIKTPNIDRIASQGVRFDQFHIAAFPCSPSRASFLTGRFSHKHGVVMNNVLLPDTIPTLGDILKDRGYNTGYVGKWHLGGRMYRGKENATINNEWHYSRVPHGKGYQFKRTPGGLGEDVPQHGFDYWVGGWKHYHQYLRDVGLDALANMNIGGHDAAPTGPDSTHIYSRVPEEHHMSAFLATRAADFIERQKNNETPFGFVLSFYGPHHPVAPPKPWDAMYRPEDVPLPDNYPDSLESKPLRQRLNDECYVQPRWTEMQFRDYVARYWGFSTYIDYQIGRVLVALDNSGKADDTVVVFCSDHGDMMASHGCIYKLNHCGYKELLNVPLLIQCPGVITPNTKCEELASSIDTLSTILDLTGIPAPQGLDGKSLLPALRGEQLYGHIFCDSSGKNLTAISDRWKYVVNWSPSDLHELYDRYSDPGEIRNLAYEEDYAHVVRRLHKAVLNWVADMDYPYASKIRGGIKAQAQAKLYDIWPEVTEFKNLGGGLIEYSYSWHTKNAPPSDMEFWSYTHFTSTKYAVQGDIAFRDTTWPDPPTNDWVEGRNYNIGPRRVQIPASAGVGIYGMRIGLYNPETGEAINTLKRGGSSSVPVGVVRIESQEDNSLTVTFDSENLAAMFL